MGAVHVRDRSYSMSDLTCSHDQDIDRIKILVVWWLNKPFEANASADKPRRHKEDVRINHQ